MTFGWSVRRGRGWIASAAVALLLARAGTAETSEDPSEAVEDSSLRSRIGTAAGARFLRGDSIDDRLIGLARLGSAGTPQAIGELVRAIDGTFAATGSSAGGGEERLAAVRALAPHAGVPIARRALVRVMTGVGSGSAGTTSLDDLVRETAALALAQSKTPEALRALGKALKSVGRAAEAARKALSAHPPLDLEPVLSARGRPTSEYIHALAALGDQRAFDELRSLVRNGTPEVRGQAAIALTRLGHYETVPLARQLLRTEKDASLRLAAAEILILARAKEAPEALASLYDGSETRGRATDLFLSAPNPELSAVFTGRLSKSTGLLDARLVGGIGRAGSPEALAWLEKALASAEMRSAAMYALARMPGEEATRILERALTDPSLRRLAVRASAIRKSALAEEVPNVREVIDALGSSHDAADRAAASGALAIFEPDEIESLITSKDAAVVASAARALLIAPRGARLRAAQRLASTCDPILRAALAAALVDLRSSPSVATSTLLREAESGGPAAPVAARALGARYENTLGVLVDFLRTSGDPWLRAHVALGLGASEDPAAVGLLQQSYRFETDAVVRHAIVTALGARREPPRMRTLELATNLDPDERVRAAARLGASARPGGPTTGHGTLWLDLRSSRPGRPEDRPRLVVVRTASGIAVPLAADPDGIVFATGLPEGPIDVRVAALPEDGKACGESFGNGTKKRPRAAAERQLGR
jgi:HEAT repeat protein